MLVRVGIPSTNKSTRISSKETRITFDFHELQTYNRKCGADDGALSVVSGGSSILMEFCGNQKFTPYGQTDIQSLTRKLRYASKQVELIFISI